MLPFEAYGLSLLVKSHSHYTSGSMIGVCEEYKVIATGDYSDGTDQVAVRLKLGESEVY